MSGLEDSAPSETQLKNACNIRHQKHLVHYGIAAAIMKQFGIQNTELEENINFVSRDEQAEENKNLLHSRVAKMFEQEDSTGDKYYRGTVSSIEYNNPITGVKIFKIRYDDRDTESVYKEELEEMIKTFKKVGEKEVTRSKPENVQLLGNVKSNDAEQKLASTDRLSNSNDKVLDIAVKSPMIQSKRGKKRKMNKDASEKKESDSFMKRRIAKYFDKDLFFGTITSFDPNEKLWKVIFDDDDQEEYNLDELNQLFKLYEEQSSHDPKIKKSPKKKKKISIASDNGEKKVRRDEVDI